MASASSFYSIAKDVAEKWGELETIANRLMTDELSKGYKSGLKNWLLIQAIYKKDFRKLMSELANEKLEEINKASKEALDIAKEFADEETKRALKVLANIDNELDEDKDFINTAFKKWVDENDGFVKAFVSGAYKKFDNSIKKIESNARSEFKKSYRVSDDTKILYDKIMQQTKDNIKDGINITYSNGRQVSFKVYMEMKVRTTLQEITSEKVERAATNFGIIFFLATERFDSADDHADYQGKVYVSKNWESKVKDDELKDKIKAFIKANGIMTVEYIKGPPVYFTTRPNCRHNLMPITNEQALGDIQKLKNTLRTKQGTYKEDNYEALKQQRQNERNLRFYKDRLENTTILYKNAVDPNIKAKLEQQISKEKGLVSFWRQRQLNLMRSNPNLRREYNRENINKMASDLGVSVKLKNDMKKTKELPKQKNTYDLFKESEEKLDDFIVKSGLAINSNLGKDNLSEQATRNILFGLKKAKDKGMPIIPNIQYKKFDISFGNEHALARYDKKTQSLYVSEKLNDVEKYTRDREKSQMLWKLNISKRKMHANNEITSQQERLEKATKSNDKAEIFFASENIRKQKITLNTQRKFVSTKIEDVILHEYGHFIHDIASQQEAIDKNNYKLSSFGFMAKELNLQYSKQKNTFEFNNKNPKTFSFEINNAKISEYATENPMEAFAESFVAYNKKDEETDNFDKVYIPNENEVWVRKAIEKAKQFYKNNLER